MIQRNVTINKSHREIKKDPPAHATEGQGVKESKGRGLSDGVTGDLRESGGGLAGNEPVALTPPARVRDRARTHAPTATAPAPVERAPHAIFVAGIACIPAAFFENIVFEKPTQDAERQIAVFLPKGFDNLGVVLGAREPIEREL